VRPYQDRKREREKKKGVFVGGELRRVQFGGSHNPADTLLQASGNSGGKGAVCHGTFRHLVAGMERERDLGPRIPLQ
jgi:hypothetical protein